MIFSRNRMNRMGSFGFTLLETVLSLVLLAIVMVSVGAAMVFASAATPDEDSPVATMIADQALLSRIAEDLSQAMYITETTTTSITAVVPDRTGDGVPDRIRYAWDGAQDDPLTYSVNGRAIQTLHDHLDDFSLALSYRSVSESLPGPLIAGAEATVASHTIAWFPESVDIEEGALVGQLITPAFVNGARQCRITKIRVMAKHHADTDGVISVQLRRATDAGLPSDEILTSVELSESSLPDDYGWIDIALPTCPVLNTWEPVCIVFEQASDELSTTLRYDPWALIADSFFSMLASDGGDDAWVISIGNSLMIQVDAEPVTQNLLNITRSHAGSVRVQLTSNASADGFTPACETRFLLSPEVLTRFWHADFDTDPTLSDLDGDGMADWSSPVAGFDSSELANGVWSIGDLCEAVPAGQFSGVVTVEARLRSSSGEGPALYGPFSANNASLLPVVTQLRQGDASSQDLMIYNSTDLSNPVASVTGLAQGWVDIRLILLTAEDTLTVEVNGRVQGTVQLARIDDSVTGRTLSVRAIGDDAEIDYIRAHVGGVYNETTNNGDDIVSNLNLYP